ncbi:LTA synthase family protein [Pseudomonas umsongensis]|uniref:Sulfatase n=2 Tax=Pseudomonas umsongensis TaxID=198618 RepID=A0ABX4DNJ0_9PSED|nr:LTA synthase family protein [Pseudomonas umsongensis]OXR28103.1 sulfatase [Pseudomonas umsongensis]QFG29174.1 LTA synthase family protein [Pseudomonas umsongensis]SDS75448.1 Phosphoglycerol transferase MdoB [Pseudomonas umsongensis]
MNIIRRWLRQPYARLITLFGLVLIVPVCMRAALGWSNPLGYLSDLGTASLLIVLLHRRPWWLALPVLLAWGVMTLATAELVSAVGRLPNSSDLHYLIDPQFLENSTGGGFAQPWLAATLFLGLVIWLITQYLGRSTAAPGLPRSAWGAPLLLLITHWGAQHLSPSEEDQWRLFNLPHQLMAASVGDVQASAEEWLEGDVVDVPPQMAGLTQLDLDGQKLLAAPGRARNVLIIALEGIPGAYVGVNRQALHSRYQENLMPNLSHWAERGMNTPDYVLHSHQTIRGLYAMLCGDYDKLDNGTPKGVEMLTQSERNQACLPAQLRKNGFATHYLQGAGLRFMAKDKIMPHIGFDATHGLEWFSNSNYLEFPWGKDDKAFFEGALEYVGQLKKQKKPWMLTLLTVGTHQPYSAPEDYLERYDTPKQAAVGYLDDALGQFFSSLERQGILKDTLVVITSDESHGIDGVRLASSWGFNLMLAPEQDQLPRVKSGVYGHVDLSASILDYFALPAPSALSGRSLFRDYETGREIMSFTNDKLRYHDGQGTLTECDFQQRCRFYASKGFIAERATLTGQYGGKRARQITARATALDHSLLRTPLNQHYQFGSPAIIPLQAQIKDDWADNLIGAQYLEMPKGSHTRVRLTVRSVDPQQNAYILLKAKELEQDVQLGLPAEMVVTADQPLEMDFSFDNPQSRKAFSFHLLGYGLGAVEVSDFSVITELPEALEVLDENPVDSSAQSS